MLNPRGIGAIRLIGGWQRELRKYLALVGIKEAQIGMAGNFTREIPLRRRLNSVQKKIR